MRARVKKYDVTHNRTTLKLVGIFFYLAYLYKKFNQRFSRFSIVDGTGLKLLSVYLIHSLPLKMSAIQVFKGDKMMTVAHLVGPSTLGYEKVLGLNDSSEVRQ